MRKQAWVFLFLLAGCVGSVNADELDSIADASDYADFDFTIAKAPTPEDPGNNKDSFGEKMASLVNSARVPSALGGAFVQLSRAYFSGREPLTPIEESAFRVLGNTSPGVREAIGRTLAQIDAMPAGHMERLFTADFLNAPAEEPLTKENLAAAIGSEIISRAIIAELGSDRLSSSLDEELAGFERESSCYDTDEGSIPGSCPNICSIKTSDTENLIRTSGYVPLLSAGDYDPTTEVQSECSIDTEGIQSCVTVVPPNCKGQIGSVTSNPVCLRVPSAQAGEFVNLVGFNFHDVDAVVRLRGVPPSQVTREVDAFVLGDDTSPIGSTVDCTIEDRISFQIPSDLPVGIYGVTVKVADPDSSTQKLQSYGEPYIEVLPDSTTRFQLASEQLTSIDVTDGEWGSDEIGIKIITVAVGADGALATFSNAEFDFGGVDSGESRAMGRVHFDGQINQGIGFSIIGYEIDNREAYENDIREFADAFELIAKGNWGKVAGALGTFSGVVASYFGSPALGKVVGAAVTAAFTYGFAVWAPADLVIQDWDGISFLQMSELTSVNVANPKPKKLATPLDVQVLVEPCQDSEENDIPGCEISAKEPGQYRERRLYEQGVVEPDDSCVPTVLLPCLQNIGSKYQIIFRYKRL